MTETTGKQGGRDKLSRLFDQLKTAIGDAQIEECTPLELADAFLVLAMDAGEAVSDRTTIATVLLNLAQRYLPTQPPAPPVETESDKRRELTETLDGAVTLLLKRGLQPGEVCDDDNADEEHQNRDRPQQKQHRSSIRPPGGSSGSLAA